MWFCSISGIGGVVVKAKVYELAWALACTARFCACSTIVRNHMIIGIVAATARSLAVPLHTEVKLLSAAANSSAWVSSRIASPSQPAAAWSIGAGPAPHINRAVLTSGGSANQVGGTGGTATIAG